MKKYSIFYLLNIIIIPNGTLAGAVRAVRAAGASRASRASGTFCGLRLCLLSEADWPIFANFLLIL